MAEENTQDMAMEDILSSIKNILEEDQINTQSVAEVAMPTEEVDDVLELSQDMRLPDVEALTSEINLDVELDEIKIPELNMVEHTESTTNDDSLNLNMTNGDSAADSLFGNESQNNDSSISELLNDVDTDFAEASDSPIELTDVIQPEEMQAVDLTAEFQKTEEVIDTFETEMTGITQTPEEAIVFEEPVVTDNTADNEPIENATVSEAIELDVPEEIIPETQVAEDNNSAVDASANIISNFAKMFAKEEAATQQTANPDITENKISLIGDGCKTIEDAVCSVIKQIIADDVAANWQKSADYENFAKQEISAYTKKWIDKNLPTIVEKIVKQEIERVMAKAGENQ